MYSFFVRSEPCLKDKENLHNIPLSSGIKEVVLWREKRGKVKKVLGRILRWIGKQGPGCVPSICLLVCPAHAKAVTLLLLKETGRNFSQVFIYPLWSPHV